jgi:hypothetical protein
MLIDIDALNFLLMDYERKSFILEDSLEYLTPKKAEELRDDLRKTETELINCMQKIIDNYAIQKA